jgi:hypothetical protein
VQEWPVLLADNQADEHWIDLRQHLTHKKDSQMWSEITFGKYEAKTLPQVAFIDPSYIYWAAKSSSFGSAKLSKELADVARKGRRIKIPDNDLMDKRVCYYVDRTSGKIANVEVVGTDQGPHVGSSGTLQTSYFDLSVPHKLASYDKTGGKFVIDAIKHHVFGNSKARLTKAKCEGFFDDVTNFG